MSEATLILPNMRGGCATVDGKVHTLFQLSSRSSRKMARPDAASPAPTRDDSGAENAAQGRGE
ncbi:hypothetical protein [Rhodopseudomonas palustris]|uniref:Uncharacterized protein n=1 Tax=Rhodopseudomonas palustris TaxID=1076 RepID=A0A418VG82_RHOPL|nr:hypothetical protein [Rhodopseudomonas palustris]RJF75056.1 hypothetical protein D4Q52_10415 [Rhodopseudomonas palustris]